MAESSPTQSDVTTVSTLDFNKFLDDIKKLGQCFSYLKLGLQGIVLLFSVCCFVFGFFQMKNLNLIADALQNITLPPVHINLSEVLLELQKQP